MPAVLEMLGIPYSGSDPLTLAATLDKDCAKRLVASTGVAVPGGFVLGPADPVEPSALAGQGKDDRESLRRGGIPFADAAGRWAGPRGPAVG